MRTLELVVLGVTLAGCEIIAVSSAQASPIALICKGSITFEGHGTTQIENETSILDYDKKVFKPPLYTAFPITRVDDSTVVFGSETGELSTFGNLDRVSGSLTMNAMRPSERQKLQQEEALISSLIFPLNVRPLRRCSDRHYPVAAFDRCFPMFDNLKSAERIELAKAKMERVLDHFLYVLELHANNLFVIYSTTLSSQIDNSFAANAFNVFQQSMHQIEIVRLCAIWDRAEVDKENIPTVIELIDSEEVIDMLAEQTRGQWAGEGGHIIDPAADPELAAMEEEELKHSNLQFGNEQALDTKNGLAKAIKDARSILSSQRLASVMNLRDKHLAHS